VFPLTAEERTAQKNAIDAAEMARQLAVEAAAKARQEVDSAHRQVEAAEKARQEAVAAAEIGRQQAIAAAEQAHREDQKSLEEARAVAEAARRELAAAHKVRQEADHARQQAVFASSPRTNMSTVSKFALLPKPNSEEVFSLLFFLFFVLLDVCKIFFMRLQQKRNLDRKWLLDGKDNLAVVIEVQRLQLTVSFILFFLFFNLC
jgi:hypothetical protein